MAADASSVVTTGMPPSTVAAGSVNLMVIQMSDSGTLSVTVLARQFQARARRRVRRRTVLVDLPLGGLTDAVHGVDGGATGPQHVGRVEHDGQRTGHVGAGLPARHHGDGLGAGGEHLVDRRLLEAVEQLADGLVDAGDAGDGGRAGDDADLVGGVPRVVRLPQRVAAPPAPHVLVDDRARSSPACRASCTA